MHTRATTQQQTRDGSTADHHHAPILHGLEQVHTCVFGLLVPYSHRNDVDQVLIL